MFLLRICNIDEIQAMTNEDISNDRKLITAKENYSQL